MIHHWIARFLVRRGFAALSRGDACAITSLMADDVHYRFEGDGALGGERYSRAAVERWFQRVLRLLPGLRLEPLYVAVSGWPWDMAVLTYVIVTWRRPDGRAYGNTAMQAIRIRWGRVRDVHTIENTERVNALLRELGERHGMAEALAAPIMG